MQGNINIFASALHSSNARFCAAHHVRFCSVIRVLPGASRAFFTSFFLLLPLFGAMVSLYVIILFSKSFVISVFCTVQNSDFQLLDFQRSKKTDA